MLRYLTGVVFTVLAEVPRVGSFILFTDTPHESDLQVLHGLALIASQTPEEASEIPACILEILAITVLALGCKRRHLQNC